MGPNSSLRSMLDSDANGEYEDALEAAASLVDWLNRSQPPQGFTEASARSLAEVVATRNMRRKYLATLDAKEPRRVP